MATNGQNNIRKVTHEFGNKEAWHCSCGNEPHLDGFSPCNENGTTVEPTEEEWKAGLYRCDNCGFVFHPDSVKEPAIVDLSTMSRGQKYELANSIIRQICSEWLAANDDEEWREKNVEHYLASISFDELAAAVNAVEFKTEW